MDRRLQDLRRKWMRDSSKESFFTYLSELVRADVVDESLNEPLLFFLNEPPDRSGQDLLAAHRFVRQQDLYLSFTYSNSFGYFTCFVGGVVPEKGTLELACFQHYPNMEAEVDAYFQGTVRDDIPLKTHLFFSSLHNKYHTEFYISEAPRRFWESMNWSSVGGVVWTEKPFINSDRSLRHNPLPVNYRPPILDDYEDEPLDLVDDGVIDIFSAVMYMKRNLPLYASTSFMNAANRLKEALEALSDKWGRTLFISVAKLWTLAEVAENHTFEELVPEIQKAVEPLQLIVIGEPYLGKKLNTGSKISRILKHLEG